MLQGVSRWHELYGHLMHLVHIQYFEEYLHNNFKLLVVFLMAN